MSLRVVVLGCGAMGRRHAAVVAADPAVSLVGVVDVNTSRAQEVARTHHTEALTEVPAGVDCVVVATPTSSHVSLTQPLLARGLWCLVEKPLAHTAAQAQALDHPRVAVGHVERFNPAVRGLVGGMERVETVRTAPWTGRSTDIDVISDLLIHDLDLLLHWGEPSDPLVEVQAEGQALRGERLDVISAALRWASGRRAKLHASRVAPRRRREVRGHGRSGPVHLDLLPKRPSNALSLQWSAFTGALRAGRRPVPGGREGAQVVAWADRVRAAALGR